MLERYFSEVDLAENGLIAFERVTSQARHYYDAIILDIDMPIMNGIRACRNIVTYLNQEHVASFIEERKEPLDGIEIDNEMD